MPDYTHIVSLGASCRLAYNLRLHFRFTTAWPFDWYVAPLASVARMLREPDPVATLYDPRHLEAVRRGGETGIVNVHNTAFDIGMNHDFPRAGEFVVPDYLDRLEAPRARQAYLFGKLDALRADAQARTLLVHYFTPADRRRAKPAQAARELGAIRESFRGRADVLLINAPFAEAGAIHLRIDEARNGPWQGDAELWAARLATLGIRYAGAEVAGEDYRIRPAHEAMNARSGHATARSGAA